MAQRLVGVQVKGKHSRRTEREPATFLPEPEPAAIFCPVVSVDDHSLEPYDVFATVPEKYKDDVPWVDFADEDVPYWVIDGERFPITFVNGAAGRPPAEVSHQACRFDEFRLGVSDSAARLPDMDHMGVWSSLCFPSTVFGFAGTRLSKLKNADAGLEALRAYNRWHIERWCGVAPERYIPCQVPWLSDPVIAAGEIRANAEVGFRSVSFSENPETLGFASLHSGAWDPFFAACAETGTVVNLHVGSSGAVTQPSSDSPPEVTMSLFPLNGMAALSDWLYSRIPLRFPELKIVLSEAGVGWVPMMLDKIRRGHRFVEGSTSWSLDDPDPTEVVLEHFYFTSIEDPSIWRSLDLVNENNIMVETDYPHEDSTWPDSQHILRKQLESLDTDVVKKLCYGNACTLYRMPEPSAEMLARSEIGARGSSSPN